MQGQNEYLRQWKHKFKDYINLLMVREAPPPDRLCSVCKKDGTAAEPSIKDIHSIASVNGPDHFFKKHHSLKLACTFTLLMMGASIPLVTDSDHLAITIVDKSGVHSLSISYCQCPGALSWDMQLFQAGLFPASFTRPKTAFTFSVLDDFLLDNLECGTSAMNYYSKIRRLTSSIFPLMVPDRYRELMRTARKWHQCKLYKWHGFAHKDDEPKAGDLTLFCPACPQPGINLDLSTGTSTRPDNTPSWLFTRTLVMDGNFKAEHLHPGNPSDEVSLMDGLAFMVGDERYKSQIATNHGPRLWHVHGHQDSCYVRIDGEIMETLWASLNIISPSARGMGTPITKRYWIIK
ncbi:uncharacterized protein EDB93DRAFT_1105234 [Suillus bovinus]|uniref:uncharacterized protein n=1 Tax=Suillus bovinus TaxID=48563 RepID=UPI001B86C490|nr:uncharacterized protein EDB93DRAFT_1105234 [Suillus bovinus]KAG2143570.1 hypothetical protein EDB93DRAFT_1105234 [Suillus bovinus]